MTDRKNDINYLQGNINEVAKLHELSWVACRMYERELKLIEVNLVTDLGELAGGIVG